MPEKLNDGPADGDLRQLYDALESEVHKIGPRCELSARCCDFKKSSHLLMATQVEVNFVLESGTPFGVGKGDVCPFLKKGLCSVHEFRPLGCRTFFCDPAWKPYQGPLWDRYSAKIRTLSKERGLSPTRLPWTTALAAGAIKNPPRPIPGGPP